jgi:hypothetical protein
MRPEWHRWVTATIPLAGFTFVLACGEKPSGRTAAPIKANVGSPNQPVGALSWHLDPRDSSATIAAKTSQAELRERFGESSISSTRVELGEGETSPGTVLFPSDSLRRVEIVWQDTLERRRPARIIIRGSQSRWQVGPGITLNTSLQELEKLNGKPFTLAGFGWDYAGVVTNWNGGALDSSLAGVKLYLDPGPAQYQSAPYSQVLGDQDYSSDLPAMQQLSPRVGTIYVDFEGQ